MTAPAVEQLFTAAQVVELAGVTHHQLDHWIRTGHSEFDGKFTAEARKFTLPELFEVGVMARLIDAGYTVTAATKLASGHRRPHWETA